jgi:phage terminase large subunit
MPWDWPRFWVIDFGYIHPFVLKRYAIDPDGRAWRYAEIYYTKRLVEDHAAQVMDEVSHEDPAATGSGKRRVWTEPKPRKVICDHDAEGRATFEEKTGLTTTPAIKTVKDGIQKMQARLRVQSDGKPRFFYIQGARKRRDPDLAARAMPTCTEEEFGGYVWADSKTKEEPVKVGDDGMDTDRYLTCDLDRGQTKWMRWVA